MVKIIPVGPEETYERDVRQKSVLKFCLEAFAMPNGDPDEAGPDVRCLRAVEEMVELAQAHGLAKELVLKQVEITYGRPAGEVKQEIGGVMITMNAYCEAIGQSLADAENDEIHRINAKPIEHFQRRQKEKREQGL